MSLHTALIKIEEEKISSEKAKKFISSEKNGAESIFIGRVRNENSGKNHPVQWETLADFTEDADEALTVYKKALDYAEASSENDYIASIHYSMAIILKEMGQSEQALDSALKANEQLNNIGDDTLQEEISELLASLR